MHVCSVVAGNTVPGASGMPFKPSVTAIRMWPTPRVFRSLITFIRNFAPSVPSIHISRMSRLPSGSIPRPGRWPCCAHSVFPNLHTQRIEEDHRDIGSSGLACQAVTSAITASVTLLMNSAETSVP